MVRRINLIVFTVLVVAAVSFMFLHNREPVTVTYGPSRTLTAQLALILIYAFFVGALVSTVASFILGAKVRLRNHQLFRQVKTMQEHLKLIEDARGQLALGDCAGAQALLAKIIQRDPDNIVARIELAETYRQQADLTGALHVLDQSRIEQKKNVELLLKASELNAELGNHTAAFDNAALILQLKPRSRFALERVVASSVQLGRIDEAIAQQNELVRMLSGDHYTASLNQLAELELRRAVRDGQNDTKTLRPALEKVLRNHRDYAPALNLLAEVELHDGNTDAAVKLWRKLFAITLSPAPLESLAVAQLARDRPAQAVAAVRTALDGVRDRSAADLFAAKLFFIQLLMHLEMLDETETEFARLQSDQASNPDVAGAYAVLRAQLLRKKGHSDEAFLALAERATSSTPPLSTRLSAATYQNGSGADWAERLERSLSNPKLGPHGSAA